jgi:CheY-like chemotaxis protein
MAARILLVEDESIVRMNLGDVLRNEGYEIEEARDGAQAVELFQNRQFDLVITDLVMPELDGFKLIARVRSISPGIPVVLITAYLSRQAGKAILQGSSVFIAKPIQLDELTAAVKHLLQRSPAVAATIYRSIRGSQIWHLCTTCSEWPTNNYDEQRVPPTTGQLCNECRAKWQVNDCREA